MRVIAVIPAWNEETRIAPVVEAARAYAAEVIVVDDGSSDATGRRAMKAGARVIRHTDNCGPGAATMTGIEAARILHATVIITLDADEQHDAHDIPALLLPIEKGDADIVFADRFAMHNTIPLVRRFFNTIGNIVTLFATGRWVHDSQCGFKAFGPQAIHDIQLRMNGFEFCTEIVRESVQHRWRTVQVPVKVLYSAYTLAKGQSFANGMKTAFKILLRSFLR